MLNWISAARDVRDIALRLSALFSQAMFHKRAHSNSIHSFIFLVAILVGESFHLFFQPFLTQMPHDNWLIIAI